MRCNDLMIKKYKLVEFIGRVDEERKRVDEERDKVVDLTKRLAEAHASLRHMKEARDSSNMANETSVVNSEQKESIIKSSNGAKQKNMAYNRRRGFVEFLCKLIPVQGELSFDYCSWLMPLECRLCNSHSNSRCLSSIAHFSLFLLT